MTFKPRRFWLPPIAVLFSGLLMWLESTLHAQNLLKWTNDVLNLPASIAYSYIHVAPGRHLYGFQSWFDRGLYLALVGVCWYLVGIELDFRLLQKMAARARLFRVSWITIGVTLQVFVIWVVCRFVIEAFRQKPGEPSDPIASAFFVLISLSWFQLAARRFWKAQQKGNAA